MQGEKGALAVIRDAASPIRVSVRAAGSRRDVDLKFTSLKAKPSMDEGSSRMKPRGIARIKKKKKNRAKRNVSAQQTILVNNKFSRKYASALALIFLDNKSL